MTDKTLYRVIRPDGGVDVSPEMPTGEYTTLHRIIADEGKLLTLDGENLTPCVDVDDISGWYEVDEPEVNHEQI